MGHDATTADVDVLDSRRAWLVAFGAALSMFAVFGVGYSFGAFFESITADFDAGSGATAVVFGITISLSFVLGQYTGAVSDRIGPRPVVIAGAVSLAAGLLLTTIVPNIWLAYLCYGLGVGFAIACGYVPVVAIVGGWFDRRRTLALGVAVAGIGSGTLVASPLAAALIEATTWRTAFIVFAIVGASLLLVAAAIVRPGPASPPPVPRRSLRELWALDGFAELYLSMVSTSFGLFVPFVFVAPFAENRGNSPFASAVLVGLIGGASIVGRLAIGGAAARFGAARLFRGSFLVMSASLLLWLIGGDSYGVLVGFAVLFGTAYGGFIALSPAVAADRFGLAGLGGLLGTWYTAAAFGALLGPFLAGSLIDAIDWWAGIAMAAAATLIGFLLLLRLDRSPAEKFSR